MIVLIGDVRVLYTITQGSLRDLSENLEEATPLVDFQPIEGGSVIIRDGDSSGLLAVQIYEDSQPEVDEVFLVRLDQVLLITPHPGGFEPALGELIRIIFS